MTDANEVILSSVNYDLSFQAVIFNYVDLSDRNSRSISNSVVKFKESRLKTLHQVLHRVLAPLHITQQLSTTKLLY